MKSNETRMRLQYGVNEADSWWHFAVGPGRERIWSRLRQLQPRIVRIFLFDKHAPDPVREWKTFESYVQAVLNLGATPMITFAKFPRPADDPRAIRWFAEQCGDVVWGAMERWGADAVSNWYWCVWNEPNSTWIGGGLTFDQYRRVYEAVAEAIVRWLGPHLRGRRPNIGGPAVEGFAPFWMDWVWRFVNEIDNSLIGFLDWHLYGDWRDDGERGAPASGATHRALMIAQTAEFGARAATIERMLSGRGILNICGELNTHSHYTEPVRRRFNHSVFGAAFYTSALLHLMRAGVHAEMYWTGNEGSGGYAMMDNFGEPKPVYHAKKLCATYVRHGDWLRFPAVAAGGPAVDVVAARGDNGRDSVLLVHRQETAARYELPGLIDSAPDAGVLFKIDQGTGNRVVHATYRHTVSFEGYGVAVVTNEPCADYHDDGRRPDDAA
jgi:hypothetical protein